MMVKPMLSQFLVQSLAPPFVEIIDNNGTWSSVTSGGNAFNGNDYYEISTLEETLPGTIAHLIISLETSDGYASNSIVPIQIGTPTVYDQLVQMTMVIISTIMKISIMYSHLRIIG